MHILAFFQYLFFLIKIDEDNFWNCHNVMPHKTYSPILLFKCKGIGRALVCTNRLNLAVIFRAEITEKAFFGKKTLNRSQSDLAGK